MKTRIGIVVAAVLALTVSCVNLDDSMTAPAAQTQPASSAVATDVQRAIGYNFGWTKALIEDEQQLRGAGLSIFATETKDGVSYDVFAGTDHHLYYDSSWTYGSIKYWKPGYTYDFVTIYPYQTSGLNATKGQVKFTVDTKYNDNGNYDEANQIDWMAHGLSASSTSTGEVAVSLKHCCSSVQFYLTNHYGSNITITDVTLNGIYKSGECTVKSDNTISWSVPQTEDNKALGNEFKSNRTNFSVNNLNATPDTLFTKAILAVPQTISDGDQVTLTVHFKKAGSEEIKTKTAKLGAINWAANGQYSYALTINQDEEIIISIDDDWISGLEIEFPGTNGNPIVGQSCTLTAWVYFSLGYKESNEVEIGGVTANATGETKQGSDGKTYYKYTATFAAQSTSKKYSVDVDVTTATKSESLSGIVPVYSKTISNTPASSLSNSKYYVLECSKSGNGYMYASSETAVSTQAGITALADLYSSLFKIDAGKDGTLNNVKYNRYVRIQYSGLSVDTSAAPILTETKSPSAPGDIIGLYCPTRFTASYSGSNQGFSFAYEDATPLREYYLSSNNVGNLSVKKMKKNENRATEYWKAFEVSFNAPAN